VDAWQADAAYSATQKSLSAPPGLAPVTFSSRAWEAVQRRRTPVANWYLDLNGLRAYWDAPHAYHHTAPVNLHYALREALRLALEEGLEQRYARHRANAELLWSGLESLDLPPLVPLEHRLTTLTTPQLSPAVDDVTLRARLLSDYNLEIAGGFGPLKGKVFRIGLMGYSSRRENITLLLAALRELLAAQ
jgi:alanine-glyoxylate transaminase/serine-glyoxylate transaminase/serine-pyruvate transaminase